jgi:hypothetical protein
MGTNEREDRAERTAHRILDAHPGAPLLIPGAIDVRGARRRDQSPRTVAHAVPTRQPAHDAGYDRERNEYEIAGGGAPAERRERPTTLLARLRRALSPAS